MRINETVGAWLSEYRREHGITLEQIADASHRYGSTWSSGAVSAMESGGGRADSVDNLLILLNALSSLTGEELKLSDVFSGVESVTLGKGYEVPVTEIVDALRGQAVRLNEVIGKFRNGRPATGIDLAKDIVANSVVLQSTFLDVLKQDSRKPIQLLADLGEIAPTSAERRLAKRLGVVEIDVSIASRQLWGHSLDDEAAARAGRGATPQKRGRVTRVLGEDISEYLNQLAARLATTEYGDALDAATAKMVQAIGDDPRVAVVVKRGKH